MKTELEVWVWYNEDGEIMCTMQHPNMIGNNFFIIDFAVIKKVHDYLNDGEDYTEPKKMIMEIKLLDDYE